MINIAIVFPVFNGLDFTKKCLESLFKLFQESADGDVAFQIVITDDGSSDGTSEWIKKHHPQVYLCEGTGDLWWTGGINKAINFALEELRCDYTLWWNNDILPDENYFINLANLLKTSDNKTIYGSKVYLAQEKDTIWSMGGVFNLSTGFKSMIGSGEKDNEKYSVPVYCDWLTGMGTITHSSVYDHIGMLDDHNFPQYHGDSDFTLRAKKAGYKIMVSPNLKIYNDTTNTGLKHNESVKGLYSSLFSIRSNYNIKKDFLFYKKHATSIFAYRVLFKKYLKYIGGFFKWKILSTLGVKRK